MKVGLTVVGSTVSLGSSHSTLSLVELGGGNHLHGLLLRMIRTASMTEGGSEMCSSRLSADADAMRWWNVDCC